MNIQQFFSNPHECEDYVDKLALYFLKMPLGTKNMVADLTDTREKFIAAVKYLMDTWAFNRIIQFNIDETIIKKNFKPIIPIVI